MSPHFLQCWQVYFLFLYLIYILPISPFRCKALCITIKFLVLWSVCLISSLVPFKNDPEYHTRVNTHEFILLLLLLLFSPREFFLHQLMLIVFHWSLSDSKSAQVSRTLLSILTDFHNAVVWIVSIRPLIFKSFSTFFFQFLSKVEVFIFLFTFF